jgi:hypothetical protein
MEMRTGKKKKENYCHHSSPPLHILKKIPHHSSFFNKKIKIFVFLKKKKNYVCSLAHPHLSALITSKTKQTKKKQKKKRQIINLLKPMSFFC